jgi:glyoxylase-like metal-dependent hydrolase (beta-lactamase superfamily II)
MTRRNKILSALAVVLAAGWAAKYIIIDRSPVPETTQHGLDLEKMRSLAQSGPLPEALHVSIVGEADFPASAVVAGEGLLRKTPMVFAAYQLVYPGEKTVMIDTALDAKGLAKMSPEAKFHPDRFDAMLKAMRRADRILLTHEHPDHIGGIAAYPDLREIQKNLALSKEQIKDKFREPGLFTPENERVLSESRPLEDEMYQSPAPGIAILKSPGHSPGTQFIYVALKNGTEFLFVGDIAWSMDNIRKLKGKPLLMNLMFLNEEREVVASQLRVLHDIAAASTKLNLVVAHDAIQLREYIKAGVVADGFR